MLFYRNVDPQMTLDYLIKTPAKKYDPKNITQISGNDALVEFIAGDLIPLSVVDSTNFKKFIIQRTKYLAENIFQMFY